MSLAEDQFAGLLAACPPNRWNQQGLAAALDESAGLLEVEREFSDLEFYSLLLSSEFFIIVSVIGHPVMSIQWSTNDAQKAMGLATLARSYAQKHQVSLDLDFYPDTDSATFTFTVPRDGIRISETFSSPTF